MGAMRLGPFARLPVLSVFLAAFFPGPAAADRLPDRAERVVGYAIDVRLDADRKQLEGRADGHLAEPVRPTACRDLWFHLYLNAFRNNRSTFFRESGGQLRGDRATEQVGMDRRHLAARSRTAPT